MADEIIRLDYSAEDIGDNIDEVRTARGTFDTLDDRLDNIEGGGPSPSNPIASNCVSPMTGYSKSSSSTPGNISTDDTLNAAIGKLEKRTELNENNILIEEITSEITAASGYTKLSQTHVYKQGKHIFGTLLFQKDSGYYLTTATDRVGSMGSYGPVNQWVGGGFLSNSVWYVHSCGQVFIQTAASMSDPGHIIVADSVEGTNNIVKVLIDYVMP